MLRRPLHLLTLLIFSCIITTGEVQAEHHYKDMYFNGNKYWRAKDYKKAMAWYARAAREDHAPSMYKLGLMHARGLGTKLNKRQAFKWFSSSAELGFHPAQFKLGLIHAKGWGVESDPVKAYMWYNIAAASGNRIAGEHREKIAAIMSNRQIVKAHELIGKWMEERGR